MAKLLDFVLEDSEFKPHLRCYIYFQTKTLDKNINPIIPPEIGYIVSLILFFNDSFGFK